MLSISNLSKSNSAASWAVHPLSLRLSQGGIIGVLGKPQSGKTTLLRLIAGDSQPNTGTVWVRYTPDPQQPHQVENWEVLGNKSKTKRWIAYVPEKLTWWQNLRFGNKNKYIESIIQQNPMLLLIDEPFKDISITDKQVFSDLINQCKKNGISVIIGSAETNEVALFDRILYMEQGKILINDSPIAILKRYASPILTIRTDDMHRLKQELQAREDVLNCREVNQILRVQFRGDPANTNNAAQAGMYVMSMTAWLALNDHNNIEVKPAAIEMEDCFIAFEGLNNAKE
jgi:ABC-type multidrug transport system ATPase subunit